MSELELMREFGRNLQTMLEEYQMSQTELAYETGLSRAAISCYIHGTKMPTLKSLVNIVYVLECDVEDLVPLDYLVE